MTVAEFEAGLDAPEPPGGLPPLLEALWHERKGNWTRAHEIAQDVDDEDGAWVHAYLHRREGDPANAGYWYRRAGRRPSSEPLEEEWREIVTALLAR